MFTCQSIHVYISMSIKPVMHISLPDVTRIFFLYSFNWIHLKLIHYFAKFVRRKKVGNKILRGFRHVSKFSIEKLAHSGHANAIMPKLCRRNSAKFGVSTAALRPRSLAYYACFPVWIYWSNNFVIAEGVKLLCCFDEYSQINLVSI